MKAMLIELAIAFGAIGCAGDARATPTTLGDNFPKLRAFKRELEGLGVNRFTNPVWWNSRMDACRA